MKREIITTGDGSHTIRIPHMNVTYHSHYGAVQESRHVFVEAGLQWFVAQRKRVDIRIFEMGFGTGLNAFLTAQEAASARLSIHYTAVEAFPLLVNETAHLNYPQTEQERALFNQLHESAWGEDLKLNEHFTLHKEQTTVQAFVPRHPFDVIYYDAFAPAAQPELWEHGVFKKLYDALEEGGGLVTYCSKGDVRRAMQRAGFAIAKIPGPPGKREMVRAQKIVGC